MNALCSPNSVPAFCAFDVAGTGRACGSVMSNDVLQLDVSSGSNIFEGDVGQVGISCSCSFTNSPNNVNYESELALE